MLQLTGRKERQWKHLWNKIRLLASTISEVIVTEEPAWSEIGNESVPKIIINDTINFVFLTAINILVITNHDSIRVLFDKPASVYFVGKIHLYLSIGNLPSVLWHSWLGDRKGIRPVKNWVVGCWHGHLVWSKVQTSIWPSWCHCHSVSLASVKCR